MGKFVARTFIPGELANEEHAYAEDFAWAAWEGLLAGREAAEKAVHGEEWVAPLYGAVGDMTELAEPHAYNDEGCFGVASVGGDWLGTKGVGTIWAPTPGLDRLDDKGICYQVSWEETYVGL